MKKNQKLLNNKIILSVVLLALLASCNETQSPAPAANNITLKIAVFSDPHYFDESLGTEGSAFEAAIANDRKLVAESQAVSEAVIGLIKAEKPDIVIVPGDLTKDGELVSHTEFAKRLAALREQGALVYVVPGNHDVDNSNSYAYHGSSADKVENINAFKFSEIYKNFGFENAIARDPASLTYIAQPAEGLWIFAIDACRYSGKSGYTTTSGFLTDETLNWIVGKLKEAKSKNIMAIGVMHHGLLEHFSGQKTNPLSSSYVVDDWENISELFAQNGMKMIFTGHFHANDISKKQSGGNFIFDIETGSAVTYPCPYRIIELTLNEKAIITTKHIASINYDTKGMSFPVYAERFLDDRMNIIFRTYLSGQFGMDSATTAMAAPVAGGAMKAHFAGDESLTDKNFIQVISDLQNSGDLMKMMMGATIQTMFTDLQPPDNNFTIDLITGKIIPQ